MQELIKIVRGLIDDKISISANLALDLLRLLEVTEAERLSLEHIITCSPCQKGIDDPRRHSPCIFCQAPTILIAIPRRPKSPSERMNQPTTGVSVFDSKHFQYAMFCTVCHFRSPIGEAWEQVILDYEKFAKQVLGILHRPHMG